MWMRTDLRQMSLIWQIYDRCRRIYTILNRAPVLCLFRLPSQGPKTHKMRMSECQGASHQRKGTSGLFSPIPFEINRGGTTAWQGNHFPWRGIIIPAQQFAKVAPDLKTLCGAAWMMSAEKNVSVCLWEHWLPNRRSRGHRQAHHSKNQSSFLLNIINQWSWSWFIPISREVFFENAMEFRE